MKTAITVIIVLALGALAAWQYGVFASPEAVVAPKGEPTFTWVYQGSSRSDIPLTTISITARYEDGIEVTKAVDEIEGSCNTYDERDADVYVRSEMIICYYAGLGHYFKVVKEGDAYLIQRKVFEEASPEYDPPVQEFETIVTF